MALRVNPGYALIVEFVDSAPALLRQQQIIDAALSLLLNEGLDSVTMARVAKLTGLSRPAIYQYFPSNSHILSEIVLNDMADLCNELERLLSGVEEPEERVRTWVHFCLAYLSSPDHSVVQTIGGDRLPSDKLSLVSSLHGMFMAPLVRALEELGTSAPQSVAGMIYGALRASAGRIESGAPFADEAHHLEKFALGALHASLSG